jgi:hypothetical protein
MKEFLVEWFPTPRRSFYLCLDGTHVRWTPYDHTAKQTAEGFPIHFKGTLLSRNTAIKWLNKLTGRRQLAMVDAGLFKQPEQE